MTMNLKLFVECDGMPPGCGAGFGGTDLDPLVRFCAEQRIEICLLSGTGGSPLCLMPDGDGSMRTVSVRQVQNPDCDLCGACPRNTMLCRSGEEDIIVYVGESGSGGCPAAYADLVFARKTLQKECQVKNISYLPYGSLDDVRVSMASAGTGLRKRRRAEAKRREVFCAE